MRLLISVLLFIMMMPLQGYHFYQDSNNIKLEHKKYLNFLAAVQNRSSFGYFTVIRVKGLNSGVVKEICTKGQFLLGALHRELDIDYGLEGTHQVLEIATQKKDRYFEFKNKDALNNISFFDYKSALVDSMQRQYNFNKVVRIINKTKDFSICLSYDEMKAFSHILFNLGYLTGENNCAGGTLVYIDKDKWD